MKKYLSKESLKEYKETYKKKGLKALLKKLGWKVFALIFVFYLVRDIILYVIGPKIFLDLLDSLGLSSDLTYPFFGYLIFLLIIFWIYKVNKDLRLKILRIGAFLGASCVILGAFGAHLLDDTLNHLDKKAIYNTAVNYHFFHTFLIIALGLLYNESNIKNIKRSFVFCLIGILMFSGSLYLFSLTDLKWLAAITPIGGVCFIISWFFLFFSFKKN